MKTNKIITATTAACKHYYYYNIVSDALNLAKNVLKVQTSVHKDNYTDELSRKSTMTHRPLICSTHSTPTDHIKSKQKAPNDK